MEWTAEQETALARVQQWMRSDEQIFRLFGYAGTGKTTLARHIAEQTGGVVQFCAYTGKAAHVLKTKGCEGASTIHSLIYHSRDKSKARLKDLEMHLLSLGPEKEGGAEWRKVQEELVIERRRLSQPSFTLNEASPIANARLVIVDECSMVDGKMGEDLLSFGTKILVLGDPAQLPPVMGGGFFTDAKADIMLQEIRRQALDNPILALSKQIREGQRLDKGQWGDSVVMSADQRLEPEEILQHDQVLVGKNATRRAYNKRLRQIHQRTSALPEAGDKLICLRNDSEVGVLNGSLWYTVNSLATGSDRIGLTLTSDDESKSIDLEAHTAHFLGEEIPFYERKEAQEFDYGYAITVHKSQGSQWPAIFIRDESRVFRDDWAKWLYTAITRAENRVTIVLD